MVWYTKNATVKVPSTTCTAFRSGSNKKVRRVVHKYSNPHSRRFYKAVVNTSKLDRSCEKDLY